MSEQQQVLTVSELNGFIKDILENVPPLSNIMVRGELSNYKIYPSHNYIILISLLQKTLRNKWHRECISITLNNCP